MQDGHEYPFPCRYLSGIFLLLPFDQSLFDVFIILMHFSKMAQSIFKRLNISSLIFFKPFLNQTNSMDQKINLFFTVRNIHFFFLFLRNSIRFLSDGTDPFEPGWCIEPRCPRFTDNYEDLNIFPRILFMPYFALEIDYMSCHQ